MNYNNNFIGFKLAKYNETNDLFKDGRNEENRLYNQNHLKSLKSQWITSACLIPPITVNVVTNHIIDGQHRLKSFREVIEDNMIDKETTIKIMYVSIPKEFEKQAIIDANTHSKNWTLDDYIHSYVKAGISSYVKLEEWCDKHILCYMCNKKKNGVEDKKYKYRYASAILTGKGCESDLKSASFYFDNQQMCVADEVHAEMLEIINLLGKKEIGPWIESLAISWHSRRDLHPFNAWIKEMKSKKKTISKMQTTNTKEWNLLFDTIHTAIDLKKE